MPKHRTQHVPDIRDLVVALVREVDVRDGRPPREHVDDALAANAELRLRGFFRTQLCGRNAVDDEDLRARSLVNEFGDANRSGAVIREVAAEFGLTVETR